MSGKKKLKLCPHCGKSVDFLGGDQCECPQDTMRMSRDLWNSRPLEDALQAENDKLRKALEYILFHADEHSDAWVIDTAASALKGDHETA